jgi:hypothetical protein
MTIDDAVCTTLDYETSVIEVPPEKKLKKERRWKNNVATDKLFVNDESKRDIVAFCERNDIQNPSYWIEKNRVMKEYTRQRAEHLMNEYNWPKWVANRVAKVAGIPRKKTSLGSIVADIGIGYSIGSWPNRYLEPAAKLMGRKRKLYTNINIAADMAWWGLYAYAIFSNDNSNLLGIHHIHNLLHNDFLKILVYANFGIRSIQIPTRAYYNNVKDKHIWSPASLVNPNLFEMAGMSVIIGYDMIQTYPPLKKAVNRIGIPLNKAVNKIGTYAKSSYKSLQQIVRVKT